jgi:hypothetical protein
VTARAQGQPVEPLWAAVAAGAVGGALAGLGDGLPAVLSGMSAGRSWWVALVGVGVAGLAGAALAALAVVLDGTLRRRMRWAFATALTAMLLAAPVVIYDSFAVFSGARAARVPGHAAISVVLALAGLAAVGLLAVAYRRLPRTWVGAVALFAVAAACQRANVVVLPRLYPWFHATLSLATLASAVLAVGFLPAASRRVGAIAVAAAAACFIGGLPQLFRSQFVRYTAHERTQLTGLLLRGLPLPRPRVPLGRGERAAVDETPLPEGPHRKDADVVLITVDALRADHVGAYGYPRATTPHIDALARRGVRFERAYAQAPHTSFSVASMLTGKYYPTIARLAPGDPHDPIAEVLRRYGWKTAAFYPPAVFTM